MSRRGIAAGLVLVAAAAVLAAALLWIARTTLRLEAAQVEAMRLAAQEEKVRLSLWRMDSALTALIGRENASPPEPFHTEAGSLAGSRFEVDLGRPQSPALVALAAPRTETAPVEGGVPVEQLAAALAQAATFPPNPAAAGPAATVEPRRIKERPRPAMPRGPAAPNRSAEPPPPAELPQPDEPEPAKPAPAPAIAEELLASPEQQSAMNLNEFNQRLEAAERQNTFLNTAEPITEQQRAQQALPGPTQERAQQVQPPRTEAQVEARQQDAPEAGPQAGAPQPESSRTGLQQPRPLPVQPPQTGQPQRPAEIRPQPAEPAQEALELQPGALPIEAPRARTSRPGSPPRPVPPSRVETTFQPVWSGGDLYLVRRVLRDGEVRMQGIRVDWPGLRAGLLGEVDDLLPNADLLPIVGEQAADPGRRLALLPVRLVAGALTALPEATWTPARLTVAAASGAIVLAAAAVALLLLGSVQQGRRRADFVSAVTHELRTPLTTLRMYTDMLSGGMVEPAEQEHYHATLSGEAERLGHLVENVLAYSRLERRRVQPEVASLEDLLAGMAGRLGAAAARGGFELVIHPAAAGSRVLVDRAAVERILLNWIDNACKYAGGAEDRRLEVQPLAQRSFVVLRLCDHGPGIPHAERRRIFRPFHKSARRAALSAPGVGLGLTLSRRLARSLGGDLRLVEATGDGAAFELRLRAAPPG